MGEQDYKKTPLWDSGLDVEKRLDHLLKELTLEEKIRCLTTGCPDIERLGIRASYMGGEAAHGIEARHDPRNSYSGQVMKKCGMKYEGTLRGADWNNQGICDACYYALLASERED